MGTIIDETVTKLSDITSPNDVDWKAFDEVLLGLDDINAYDDYYEETILSSYILYGDFFNNGEHLPEAIRHFLSCGYDVLANDGKNGGLSLSNLCWSSYDKHILEAAKVLMNAGAPVIYRCKDDDPDEEPQGLLGSIDWKIAGAWSVDKDYNFANILEAYYQMAQANIVGKNYNAIYCFTDCIGLPVTSILASSKDSNNILSCDDGMVEFSEPLVMICGDKPLVVGPYIDFVVNAVYLEDNKEKLVDVSSSFSKIIGSTLERIEYMDSTICRFEFSSGYQIVFSSRIVEDRIRTGTYQFLPIDNTISIEEIDIDCICGSNGVVFADTVTNYTENALALFGKNESYLMYYTSGSHDKCRLQLTPCPKELLTEYTRQYPVGRPDKITCFYENEEVTSVRFDYDDEFMYLKTNEFPQIEVQISDYKYDPSKIHSLRSQDGNHLEFSKRES